VSKDFKKANEIISFFQGDSVFVNLFLAKCGNDFQKTERLIALCCDGKQANSLIEKCNNDYEQTIEFITNCNKD
jgi:hypothetical protein